jgi:hypothetical protein
VISTLAILVAFAQAPEADPSLSDLPAGEDLVAWRSMRANPSAPELERFLRHHTASPLAELALRRLEHKGLLIATKDIEAVIESLLNHEARLTQAPQTTAIATIEVPPLRPEELPDQGTLASVE